MVLKKRTKSFNYRKLTRVEMNGLYIISSPFQAICAIESITFYKIIDPVFIVLHGQQKMVNSKTAKIIEINGFKNIYELTYSTFYDILLKSKNDISTIGLNYAILDYIFIGNYYSPTQRIFSSLCYNSIKTKLIYMDDGNSTIEAILWGLSIISFNDIKQFLKLLITKIINKMKCVNESEFFTIFEISSLKYKISPNSLMFLKNQIKIKNRSNVYIIGGNFLSIKLLTHEDYLSYLQIFLDHIKKNFRDETIYYCPHRGESDKFINYIANQYNLKIARSDYSVEYDFATNNVKPIAIYSFGSTASYSLKLLFPDSFSYVITPKIRNNNLQRSYNEIIKVYKKANIISLDY